MKPVWIVLCACLPAAHPAAAASGAEPYPSRPVRLIVPYPPGGGNDTLARIFGQKLGERWSQQVVIDNRPGAGTTIGAQLAAKAAADGYTLLLSSIATHALAPALYAKPGYDPIKDFTAVTILAVAPTLCVAAPNFAPKTIKELIALAKAKPDDIRFVSGGNGTTPHIAGEVFKAVTGVQMTHVPYKGGGPAHVDLMAGRVQVMFDTAASASPHVRSGKMRALAIGLPARYPDLPEVPTFAEAGLPEYNVDSWYSLHATAGTPKPIVERIHQDIVSILAAADIRERLRQLVSTPGGMAPGAFDRYVRTEHARYEKIIKATGIRID
ncbi:MAG: tripartite tricarboxylate transporter substrate binding protein [Burkholderiales bacterium]|nr:tripartite tricarboxylate transporter substrate binding protein [Burkholderiales bacterium]